MRGAERGSGASALLDALAWPNVVGKRCLVIGRHAPEVRATVEAGRADAVEVARADELGDIDADAFDLTIGWAVITDASAPLESLARVHRATRGLFLSIEPIDPLLTVGGRPLPLLRVATADDGQRWRMNGRAHFRLLTEAGFVVERPSGIIAVATDDGGPPGIVERWLGRVLTSGRPGTPHRALIGRTRP